MGVHIMPKSKLSLASKAKLDEQKHEKKSKYLPLRCTTHRGWSQIPNKQIQMSALPRRHPRISRNQRDAFGRSRTCNDCGKGIHRKKTGETSTRKAVHCRLQSK